MDDGGGGGVACAASASAASWRMGKYHSPFVIIASHSTVHLQLYWWAVSLLEL